MECLICGAKPEGYKPAGDFICPSCTAKIVMKIRALENSTNISITSTAALELAKKRADKKEKSRLNSELKKIRKAKGWSAQNTALLLGVSRQYLNQMESGAKPLNTKALRLIQGQV
jgi:DNA-binding transcriptional regulator YiaG